MGRISHTRAELARDFRRMGVRAGTTVILHSSMKSIGHVAGGAATVIRALQDAVTRAGTILMPAFSYSLDRVYGPIEPFDPARSPADTGLIPETFRLSRGVLRSRHPTHSVAAWGKGARAYLDGHERLGAFDPETPVHRASRDGALVLMVGCSFTSLSLLHVAEVLAGVSYLGIFCWAHAGWRPEALLSLPGGRTERVRYPYVPGCSSGFGVLERVAERKGLLGHAFLGNAAVLVFRASDVLDLAVARLRAAPDFLLCPPTTCRACDEKRAAFAGRSPHARRVGRFLIDTMNRTGIRLAGSPEERQAAEAIAARFAQLGLESVRLEELPISAWEPGRASLRVRIGPSSRAAWQEVPCAPCSHAPATPRTGIEAEMVSIESMGDLGKLRGGRGGIGVLWDGFGASEGEFRRLMSFGFRGFIYVDRRFSHEERVAVGIPARWLRHLRSPMISVPFPEAARLFSRAPARARMSVASRVREGTSCNAIGEIRGRSGEAIVVCAHHDSTFNSAAADDNLSGVAALLEIARALVRTGRHPRHTLRFCSFGAEELLSEGARFHALVAGGARDVRFVLNNDSIGARVGSTDIHATGPEELTAWIRRRARSSSLQFRFADGVTPFSDHFVFNVAGSPSLWFYRTTLASGRHFHHTTRDGLAELSVDLVAQTATFQASLVRELAYSARWPFPPRLPRRVADGVAAAAHAWLGRSG